MMWIMEVVWPVTVLYFGPLGWYAYWRWGRPKSHRWQHEHSDPPQKSFATTVGIGVSHCGAGCTLEDIIGRWIVFLTGFEIAGIAL
jgi:hypothetical protein